MWGPIALRGYLAVDVPFHQGSLSMPYLSYTTRLSDDIKESAFFSIYRREIDNIRNLSSKIK